LFTAYTTLLLMLAWRSSAKSWMISLQDEDLVYGNNTLASEYIVLEVRTTEWSRGPIIGDVGTVMSLGRVVLQLPVLIDTIVMWHETGPPIEQGVHGGDHWAVR
jgi:hypothetical protein